MRRTLSVAVLTLSLVYLYWLEPRNIFAALGWSSVLVPWIWLSMIVTIRYHSYQKEVFAFALMLVGLVVMNHLLTNFGSIDRLWTLGRIGRLLVFSPIVLVMGPFAYLIAAPFKITLGIDEETRSALRNLRFLPVYSFVLVMFAATPFAIETKNLNHLPLLTIIALLFFVALCLAIFLHIRSSELEYFFDFLPRLPQLQSMVKFAFVLFILSIIGSVLCEFTRGMWVEALLFIISLLLMALNLFAEYRYVFRATCPGIERPEQFRVPIVATPRALFMIYLGGMLYMVLFIIIRARY